MYKGGCDKSKHLEKDFLFCKPHLTSCETVSSGWQRVKVVLFCLGRIQRSKASIRFSVSFSPAKCDEWELAEAGVKTGEAWTVFSFLLCPSHKQTHLLQYKCANTGRHMHFQPIYPGVVCLKTPLYDLVSDEQDIPAGGGDPYGLCRVVRKHFEGELLQGAVVGSWRFDLSLMINL